MMEWLVVCAGCGKEMPINTVSHHWVCKHNWRTLADGSVDERSNPFWKQGGILF